MWFLQCFEELANSNALLDCLQFHLIVRSVKGLMGDQGLFEVTEPGGLTSSDMHISCQAGVMGPGDALIDLSVACDCLEQLVHW